ncbi:TonB-dependent receptor [Pseudoflavitalea sp. G-6-1-2]|uniref:SusC/RagA family TonB-linked outer membrane protein n=1 Tax=Pseudoflavitalea sp. G-6-1-2 TaxID=2728841 RepID=UPI00146BB16E|nr:TonB-dependent receptor [Pseudoflavitalea sp. G-6-1-2]NML22364.1 TonB-dependent receptor [Pseudoflavitalea sp. G-6-1-2]
MLLPFLGLAQTDTKEITGVIKDAKGEGIPGVTVKIRGTAGGVTTDANGKFSLKAPKKQITLQISSVGYVSQEILVGDNTSITVSLEAETKKMDEVVVIGYGTAKKKDLTGSVSSISKDQMNIGGITSNAAQAIQGRAAGVQVAQTNAAPGGETIIRIRGGNSIKSSNEPLYVVDGFISSTGKDISPNDIEDIEILKDASATAIYGARGANGVVLITTKRGKKGKPVVQYDGYYGFQKILRRPKLMNAKDYMAVTNAKAAEQGNPPEFSQQELNNGVNTDWFDLATRTASVQSHDFSVSGGGEDSRIFMSGNYFDQIGALKRTDYSRYSGRMNAEKDFGKKLKVGMSLYGARSRSAYKTYDGNIVPSNVLYGLMFTSPSIAPYNADGTYQRRKGRDNPLAWLLEPTNDRFTDKLNANAFIDYELIKGLTLRVNAGTEVVTTKEGNYVPTTLVPGEKVKGQATLIDYKDVRNLVEAYLTYKRSFGDHDFTLMGGLSRQRDVLEQHYTQVQKFTSDKFLYNNLEAAAERIAAKSYKHEDNRAAFYGRLTYAFKDKYLATFTLRDEGSSFFLPDNSYGLYPSAAVAWRLDGEEFINKLNLFSTLKLRVGYGTTGNDRLSARNIPFQLFGPTNVSLGEGSQAYGGMYVVRAANPGLGWESNGQIDVGLDMGFANNRIMATVDYYRKKTTDLFIDLPLGQWWGFSSYTANAGTVLNQGIELSINTENFNTKEFRWNTNFNVAWNKQKATSLGGSKSIITQTANPDGSVPAADFTKLEVGKELSMLFGYVYDGVIQEGEKYAAQPDSKPGDPKFRDLNGDNAITAADRDYLGNANPHWIFGFGNDFSYKGFDLSIFFQGAWDFNLYNMNRLLMETYTGVDALRRWTPQNTKTDVPRNGYFTSKYGGYINSRFVEDASYLRCKMITLGYNLPLSRMGVLSKLKGIKVYGSVQNLFTVTGYTGTDPEVNTRGGENNLAAGLDFNAYPSFRTFTFGLKMNF